MKVQFTLCFILFFATRMYSSDTPNAHKEKTTYTAKALDGDGIWSLLNRYDLVNYNCNVTKFYELNNLSNGDILHKDKEYKLPIYILKYDDKSIRSTIGVDDWDKAVRIKAYNENLLKNNLRTSSYTESKILWVPFHEMECNASLDTEMAVVEDVSIPVPKRKEYITQKVLGRKYEQIEVVDHFLKDKVFYIVSGHGGPDSGAQCQSCPKTMCEDEYAYDVALRLGRDLMQHGAIVEFIVQDPNDGIRDDQYLPCDRDERSYQGKKLPLNQKMRLKQRADDINILHRKHKKAGRTDQIAIMIHVDSRNENKKQDVYFYHLNNSESGKKIAKNIHETFESKYNKFQKDRGYHGYVKERNLYMLKNTHPTAVYVELANIRNTYDHKRLLIESNRQALANWLFEGLIKEYRK